MNEILQNLIGPREASPAESTAGAPGAKARIEQAWLRELERAQWRQRPVEARRGAATPDAKGGHAPEDRGAARAAARAQTTEDWVASRAAQRPAGRSFDALRTGAAAGEEPLPGGKAAQSPFAARGADAARLEKPALAFEAEIAARLWGEPRKWEPRRVHARERGRTVWIWIRDAEFDASGAGRLTASLAQLAREAGLELEGITVNGHVVFGPGPDDDPSDRS